MVIDDQIIGALSDMELVDQQGSGLMDTDVNEDDLLGVELMEMEGDDPLKADRVNADFTKVMGSIDEKRTLKHKMLGVRRGAPLARWVAQAGSSRSSIGVLQANARIVLIHLYQRELRSRDDTGQVQKRNQTVPKVMFPNVMVR